MAFDFEGNTGKRFYAAEKGKLKSELCRFLCLNPTSSHEKINRVLEGKEIPFCVEVKLETEGPRTNEIYMEILPRE